MTRELKKGELLSHEAGGHKLKRNDVVTRELKKRAFVTVEEFDNRPVGMKKNCCCAGGGDQ